MTAVTGIRFQRAVKPRIRFKSRLQLEDALIARVEVSDAGCWVWTGAVGTHGYGVTSSKLLGERLVHRHAYALLVGPIPTGFQVDHVKARGCTSLLCANPDHLEAVTQAENLRRQGKAVTHCPRGHEYTEANTYRSPRQPTCRRCRECTRITQRTAGAR